MILSKIAPLLISIP